MSDFLLANAKLSASSLQGAAEKGQKRRRIRRHQTSLPWRKPAGHAKFMT